MAQVEHELREGFVALVGVGMHGLGDCAVDPDGNVAVALARRLVGEPALLRRLEFDACAVPTTALGDHAAQLARETPPGEFVIVVAPPADVPVSDEMIRAHLETAMAESSTVAITEAVNAQISKRKVSSSAESSRAATNTIVRSANDCFCCA